MKDPLLQQYTIEELQIEWLMYAIEEDPQEAYPNGDMSNIQFRTGDPVIDDWEKRLAGGEDPSKIDWDVGVDQDFLTRFKAYSRRVAGVQSPTLAEARLKEEAAIEAQQLPPAEQEEFLQSLVGGFTDEYT
jgi:hypothetical protein